VDVRGETRGAAALPDDRPEELLDRAHGVAAGKEPDQDLLGGRLGLGQKIQVTELAFVRSNRVVVGHLPQLGGHVGPAASAPLDDGPHLLVAEPRVGAVATAVVDVVDHVRRLGTGRDVHKQAAPARPVGVGNLMAAHHQRRADLVAGDLVDAVGEPGQLNATHPAGAAVVVLDPDYQQSAVDGQGRQVLGQLGVVGALAAGELLLEVHPMGLIEQPTGGGLDDVGPRGGRPPALLRPQVCAAGSLLCHGFVLHHQVPSSQQGVGDRLG
jgi:hypothetical protein